MGIRLGELTQTINKSLLPVAGKAVISHIIEKFSPDIEIIIALGYQGEKIKEYLSHAHPERNFTFVEVDYQSSGTGPAFSLFSCKEYLNCPFIVCAADTIVEVSIPEPDKNWMGVCEVPNTERFCSVKIKDGLICYLDDKKKTTNKFAFIGLAGIKDYQSFFNSLSLNKELINNEMQLSNGLKGLINLELHPEKFDDWYDTGTADSYYITRKAFEKEINFDKINEFTYLVNGRLVKFFNDPIRVSARCKRAEALKELCPEITKQTKWFYSYNLLKGQTLYNCFNPKISIDFFNWCKEFLWKEVEVDKKEFELSCWKFYFNKTLERITLFHQKYTDIDPTIDYTINGFKIPCLNSLLKDINWNWICDGIPSLIHGDLQFDNILKTGWLSTRKEDFKLLDWRDDFGGSIEYGDLYYDLAKLYGGLTISYAEIKEGKFHIEEDGVNIAFDFAVSHLLNESRVEFEKFVKESFNFKKIEVIRSLIFLNMAPLHTEPFDRLLYFMGLYYLDKSFKKNINK